MELIDDLFGHVYFLALYGVLTWYAAIYSYEASRPENKRKKNYFKAWRNEHIDDIIVTILICPLLIIFDEEAIFVASKFFNIELSFSPIVYIMAGPFTHIVFWSYKKIRS